MKNIKRRDEHGYELTFELKSDERGQLIRLKDKNGKWLPWKLKNGPCLMNVEGVARLESGEVE